MTMIVILSNLLPLTVIAETSLSNEEIQLKDFTVTKNEDKKMTGELGLTVANNQELTSEKVLTFDPAVVVTGVKLTKDNSGITVEKAGAAPDLNQSQTTTASDGLSESPLQPSKPIEISENQVKITVQPKTNADIKLALTFETEETKLTVQLDNQQLAAEIPQVENSDSTTSQTSQTEESSTSDKSEESTSTSEKQTTESSTDDPGTKENRAAPRRAAANIKDLIDQYSPGDRFIDSVEANIPDPAKINQASSLKINFSIPETVRTQLQIGDYYEVPLPTGLDVANFVDEPLVDPDNPTLILGRYTIDPTTKMIRIVLTDTNGGTTGNFEPLQSGEINVSTEFDRQVITKPGRNQIIYPSEYNLPPLSIMIQPDTATSVSKAGNFDKQINPEKISWSVDVNKDLATLNAPTINETFPANTTFESAQVFPLNVDFSGNVTSVGNTAVNPDDYQIDANGNIQFNQTIEQAYRVVYQTLINDDAKPANGGSVTFTNNVSFNGLPASASVTANYGQLLEKVENYYSPENQEYSWSIHYNYGQKQIANGATITDNFSNNMDISANDVKLYYMIANPDGSFSRGQLVPTNAYSVNIVAGDPTNQLIVTFNENVAQNQAISIDYSSKINTIVSSSDSPVITNSAETNGITTTPNVNPPIQQAVVKERPTVEVGSKVAKWSVDINRNGYQLNNAIFTDRLEQTEKGYVSYPFYLDDAGETVPGVQIIDEETGETLTGQVSLDGQPIIEETNPDFEINIVTSDNGEETATGDTYQYFTVEFLNAYQSTDHSFRMNYQTKYNQFSSSNPPDPQRVTYNNDISLEWADQNNGKHQANSNNGFETTTQEANQGEKSGSYNPVTKEITWTIVANYNNAQVEQFSFTDPITSNQVYIKDSLNITRGTIDDSNGSFVATDDTLFEGEQKAESYISYQEPQKYFEDGTITDPENANNELSIAFGNEQTTIPGGNNLATPKVYQIQFKTSLKGQIIQDQSSYDNIAHITLNGVTENLPASVSIRYSNESVDKTVDYNPSTNIINWGLWLNRNQSLLVQPTITDLPSNNQTIDPDSVEIYRGEVAANGTVTQTDQTLRQGTDYTVEITTNNQTGQQQMVIAFSENYQEAGQTQAGFIEKPYFLSYQARPNFTTSREQVSNSVNVTTKEGMIPHPGTQQSQLIQITNTDGTAIGEKGSVTIQKTDNNGAILAGATLTLTRVFNREGIPEQELYEITTDQAGQITFGNLVYTNTDPENGFRYVLRETKAPDGYTISDELLSGIELTVDQNSSQPTNIETVVNQPVAVTFNKENETGDNISGGLFALTKENEADQYVPVGLPFAAETNGKRLSNLTDGNYRLLEITPPLDSANNLQYLLNLTPLAFEVTENSQGQHEVLVDGTPTDTLTLTNYRGSAQLYKENENNQPIENAEFSIEWAPLGSNQYSEYQSGTDFETNQAGILNLTDLIPGKYRVTEIAVPNGYYVNNQTFNFAIQGYANNQAPEPVEINTPETPLIDYLGNARFKKIDGNLFVENGEERPLAGAQFQLYGEDGQTTIGSPVTSDEDGYFTFEDLSAGENYRIREITPPAGFVLNDTEIRFTMPTSTDSNPVFITNASEKLVYDEPTTVKNYKEHVRFRKLARDSLQEDTTKGLADAKYTLLEEINSQWRPIENPQDYGANQDGYFVSAEDGYVRGLELSPGNYKFVEAQAPTGYLLNTKEIPFTIPDNGIGDPGVLDISINDDENVNYQGAAELTKTTEAGEPLAGSIFEVLNSENQKIAEATSDDDGKVYVEGLAPGDYSFKEIATADNQYLVNEKSIPFTIPAEAAGAPKVVTENTEGPLALTNYLGSAELTKFAADGTTPLAGATFEVYDASGQQVQTDQTFTTNREGKITVSQLSPGDYTFVEIKAPEGYLLNTEPIPFTIANSAVDQPVVVSDPTAINYQSSAKILKEDEAGNPLAGAKFSLERQTTNGWQVVSAYQTAANWLTSADDGSVLVENLAPGTYRFKEEVAPENYLLNTAELPAFEIAETSAGEPETVTSYLDGSGQEQPLKAINYQGSAQIQKYTEENGQEIVVKGAIFSVIDAAGNTVAENIVSQNDGIATAENLAPGTYQFKETQAAPGYILNQTLSEKFTIQTEAPGKPEILQVGKFINFKGTIQMKKVDENGKALADAHFELWKMEDGQESQIAEEVSDAKGNISITALAPGDYQLRETIAPNGYLLNEEPRVFKIDSAAIEQKTQDLGNFTNYRQSVKWTKENEAGQPLAGAEFQLQNPAGNPVPGIGKIISNQQGEVDIKDLAPGSYQIKETKAPAGYIVDTEVKSFTVETNQAGKPESKELSTWINYHGELRVTKVNEDGEKLKEAVFQLFDEQQNLLQPVLKTDANGQFVIDKLVPGKYFVKELAAPLGYQKSEKLYPVTVTQESAGRPETIQLTISNKKMPASAIAGGRYPQTNDENEPILWILGVLLVSFGGIGLWLERKKIK